MNFSGCIRYRNDIFNAMLQVQLEKLEAKVSENSEKLAAIEQYHAMINVPLPKR